jgi:hypothetical protein
MSKTSKQLTKATQNRRKAFEYRVLGYTYDQIGKAIGCTRQNAFHLVKTEMEAIQAETRESAKHLLELDLERTERVIQSLMPERSDPAVANAIATQLARRAKLLGLDAPDRIEGKQELVIEIRKISIEESHAEQDTEAGKDNGGSGTRSGVRGEDGNQTGGG